MQDYGSTMSGAYEFVAAWEEPTETSQGEIITMSKNFRSRREVLSSINYVFDQIMTHEAAETWLKNAGVT